MEDGPFSAEDFATAFGDDVVLFCHVTTRIEGRENDGMLREVGGRGFPTMVFLDADGKKLGTHNGGRDAAGFQASLQLVNNLQSARERAAKGDEAARFDVLVAEIDLGLHDLAAAEAARDDLGKLTDEQTQALAGRLAGLEFAGLTAKQRELGKEGFQEKVQAMLEGGRIPGGPNSWRFWMTGVLPIAIESKDKDLAQRAMKVLEDEPFFDGDNDRYLQRFREAVEQL